MSPIGHRVDDFPRPPLHNLLLTHDNRYWQDERGCPPGCQYRRWVEKHLRRPNPSDGAAVVGSAALEGTHLSPEQHR